MQDSRRSRIRLGPGSCVDLRPRSYAAPTKTKIVDVEVDGFEFLGYRFIKHRRFPRKKSMMKFKDTIRHKTTPIFDFCRLCLGCRAFFPNVQVDKKIDYRRCKTLNRISPVDGFPLAYNPDEALVFRPNRILRLAEWRYPCFLR